MDKLVNIAILGLGTVGGGTYEILEENRDLIRKRTGKDFRVAKVLEIDPKAYERFHIDPALAAPDYDSILQDPSVDIIVEAFGGVEPASRFMLEALEAGKHVVTPNKAAIASNYEKLTEAADRNGVLLRMEACVGGGIPILDVITNNLAGNRFRKISGIVNGTTNYILTQMTESESSYEEVLLDAKRKGFAEADPSSDVEGIDSANKLSILMALCFGCYIAPEDIPTSGITHITTEDIRKARKQGEVIKLIAEAEADENGNVTCSVSPRSIPKDSPFALVNNEFNIISVTGDAVGEVTLTGKGAGKLPTGSAVVGDIMYIMERMD